MIAVRDLVGKYRSLAGAPGVLSGAALVAIVGGMLLAFATIDAPPLRSRHSRQTQDDNTSSASSDKAPAFGHDIVLPSVTPPPQPTSGEIMQSAEEEAPPSNPGLERSADVKALSFEELRRRANRDDVRAMEEMARRLIDGVNIAKDTDAGAGWMLRAAERGSAQSAFDVGVMYERGFVVERDLARAAQWYRRAADAGYAEAEHNLALLLREGKGVPRDGAQAIQFLHAAARQGMTASMFTLGDIYETGDAAPKDNAAAAAWFSITAVVEQQNNKGAKTTLGIRAEKRSEALQRLMTPEEMAQAREIGQREYRGIVNSLTAGPKPLPTPALPDPPPAKP